MTEHGDSEQSSVHCYVLQNAKIQTSSWSHVAAFKALHLQWVKLAVQPKMGLLCSFLV